MKKAHKHKFFCPVALGFSPGLSRGQTRLVPGTNPVKTWDKPRLSPNCTTQWKPGKPGFVPGTHPGSSLEQTNPGKKAAQKVYVKKVYVPSPLAINQRGREKKGPPDIAPKSFSQKGPKWCSVPSMRVIGNLHLKSATF